MPLQNSDMHGTFVIEGVTVDPASMLTDAISDLVVTVPGLLSTDLVIALPPIDLETGIAVQGANVTAANTLSLRLMNTSAGTINAASKATWKLLVFRR